MKCIRCDRDSNKKDRDQAGGRCPYCQHSFVCKPEIDKVTDRLVKNAEDAVSENGTFYFLLAHLRYEIIRRRLKKTRRIRLGCLLVSVITLTVPILTLTLSKQWEWILGALLLLSILGFMPKFRPKLPPSKPINALLKRWTRVNPNKHCLSPPLYTDNIPPSSELGEASFDRVLICDRDETVDFFLANLFHFHYSCPVLGGNHYPKGISMDMLRRLKTNPKLVVFFLHDLSPSGLTFPARIKQQWFADRPSVQFIDLGLSPPQHSLYSRLRVPLAEIPGNNQNTWPSKLPKLPRDQGAELTLLRPQTLIQLCGAGINQLKSFHLLERNQGGIEFGGGDWDSDGYG